MKISVYVIEDELIHQEAIRISLEELNYHLLGICNNADIAFDEVKRCKPQVVLIDIALPGINNGITLAKRIHQELNIPHIFTTAFTSDDVIAEAATTSPAAYLTKPVDTNNLKAAVSLALTHKQDQQAPESHASEESFFTKVGDKLVRINMDDILFVKSDGANYISVVSEQREVSCRCTLKDFSQNLPDNFLQTHRSYIINLKHLDSYIETDQIAMLKGKAAPISRSYKTAFLSRLKKW